jgi:hypothetical protein
MNETEEPMDDMDEGAEIDISPRKRLPTLPLLENLPSKTCRRLLARIRKHELSSDQLFRLVRDHAGRGMLQQGELRVLTTEINRLYAPNREPEAIPKAPEDDASKGIRDGPGFKTSFFRKPPSWGQKGSFGPRENALEKSARLRIAEPPGGEATAARPAFGRQSEPRGARVPIPRKR